MDLFFIFALQTLDFETDVAVDADAADVAEVLAEDEESEEPASTEAKFVCFRQRLLLELVSTLIPKNLFHASA